MEKKNNHPPQWGPVGGGGSNSALLFLPGQQIRDGICRGIGVVLTTHEMTQETHVISHREDGKLLRVAESGGREEPVAETSCADRVFEPTTLFQKIVDGFSRTSKHNLAVSPLGRKLQGLTAAVPFSRSVHFC